MWNIESGYDTSSSVIVAVVNSETGKQYKIVDTKYSQETYDKEKRYHIQASNRDDEMVDAYVVDTFSTVNQAKTILTELTGDSIDF